MRVFACVVHAVFIAAEVMIVLNRITTSVLNVLLDTIACHDFYFTSFIDFIVLH